MCCVSIKKLFLLCGFLNNLIGFVGGENVNKNSIELWNFNQNILE